MAPVPQPGDQLSISASFEPTETPSAAPRET
jgi:hypothetical protein